jgi:prepilin-type N-terminal cleavage/methylation domain-containing protein
MKLPRTQFAKGYSLVELLVAMALGLLVVGAGVVIFRNASNVTSITISRSDMQQNARGTLAIITRDLSQASIGIPQSGIALPSGGTGNALAACGPTQCYLQNGTYPNNLLAPVVPFAAQGANNTDAITVVYVDNSWPDTNKTLTDVAQDGSTITVNTGTFDSSGNPAPPPGGHAYDDPVYGSKPGDVMMIFNTHGYSVATVTGVGAGGVLSMAAGDPLNLNQPTATAGNVSALKNAPNPPPNGPQTYPTTSAVRINIVTYFVQTSPGPDGVLGMADDYPVLMRQVNAQNAIPLVDYASAMQTTYDIYNSLNSSYQASLDGAQIGNASEIRKINITLTLRSPAASQGNETYTISTAVSPRDLSFKDRYN